MTHSRNPVKQLLHKNNRHRDGYDFKALTLAHPALSAHVIFNKFNKQETIDFSKPHAVKALNTALLKHHYQIKQWDIPSGYLCPAIPGRVDYIHYLAELLSSTSFPASVKKTVINALDIGTGSGAVYPLLAHKVYDWQVVCSEIDSKSILSAKENIEENDLTQSITLRPQPEPKHIFRGIIQANEFYHVSLCNPPFHKSFEAANAGTNRKWDNLKGTKSPKHSSGISSDNSTGQNVDKGSDLHENKMTKKAPLNFGGQHAELWCAGGEVAFIRNMIHESKFVRHQVLWFTCLVSKKAHLGDVKLALKKAKVKQRKVVKMAQGNKVSRFVAWSFFDEKGEK
jgi:23S rRNA (adenine1618-N6)-methyltransferase